MINEIVKKRIEHRTKVLARYKRIKGCYKCGYNANSLALQFHHVDPKTKHKTVASLTHRSWKVIKNEINKCKVICANCHVIETLLQTEPTKRRIRIATLA